MTTQADAGRRGFTLLEVLIALALTIMLMGGVFAFYASSLQAREEARTYTNDIRLFRSLLRSMAEEIRHTTAITPGDGIGFRGERDKITLVKIGLPENYAFDEYDSVKDKLPPAQLDLRRITYEMLWDEERKDEANGNIRLCHGLWRTEQKTFDPNPRFVTRQEDASTEDQAENEDLQILGPQPEGELYAPEIKFVEFAYFDGAQWRDRWQPGGEGGSEGGGPGGASGTATGPMSSGSSLPQAIRVTLGKIPVDPEGEMFDLAKWEDLEAHPDQKPYHPDRFTIVVPIAEADRTLMSSRQYGVADSMARQEGGPTQ